MTAANIESAFEITHTIQMCNFKRVFIAPHKNQRKIQTIGIDFTGSLYFKLEFQTTIHYGILCTMQ